jgi:hypothetical protein
MKERDAADAEAPLASRRTSRIREADVDGIEETDGGARRGANIRGSSMAALSGVGAVMLSSRNVPDA